MVAHRASTKFTALQVKSTSPGTAVTVTCKGSGCPKALKGKGYVKQNAPKTLSLKAFIKTPLRAGITITVTVTKPNAIGAVKVLKVRAAKKPLITTKCLPAGSQEALVLLIDTSGA